MTSFYLLFLDFVPLDFLSPLEFENILSGHLEDSKIFLKSSFSFGNLTLEILNLAEDLLDGTCRFISFSQIVGISSSLCLRAFAGPVRQNEAPQHFSAGSLLSGWLHRNGTRMGACLGH